jgi:WD40 repeat protein
MTTPAGNVKEIFGKALELSSPTDRNAYLEQACGGNAELLAEVQGLLNALNAAGPFLNRPGKPAAEQTTDHVGETPGTIIADRYKLLEELGAGGMGAVWVAEQVQPVRRKVAIKLIKPGMDTRQVLSRFEAERQALALMDHPNIAKVLDGGRTDQGRPFFVMEYVKGVPITRYADDARLTVRERLELFIPICQAVQHAHQKGVIHRDLKPSNILICLYDGKPVPKVIDFGLAKALHQPLTEHTLYTAHGMMLGTPLYMSPEQAELNNLDVDTRTDVYSLGVILYELLTGTTPLEKHRFKESAWQEIIRLIKEVDPPRPSTRLSGSGSLPSVAAQRRAEPLKLSKLLRGELDWIVMKALEKDRSRRYESATGLARDVDRYLRDEAVEACPPSAAYRLRKLARKYRTALRAAAACVLLLLIGVAASTWQAIRATRAEATALAERDEKEEALNGEATARNVADQQRAEAQRERGRAETNLYHSLVREAEALRRVRDNGYRHEVWDRLRQALALETRDKDPSQLRQEAAACLGDFLGLKPTTWENFGSDPTTIALHPDSPLVAIGLEGGTILLRDLTNGAEIARVKEHRADVANLSFAAVADRMASADLAGVVKIWHADAGSRWACERTIPVGRPADADWGPPILVVLNSDGKLLFTYSQRQPTVSLWNLTDGARMATFNLPGPGVLHSLALSPNGKLLAAAYDNSAKGEYRLLVWDVVQRTLKHDIASDVGRIDEVGFGSNGDYLAYAGFSGGGVRAGPKLERVSFARFSHVFSVQLSADDRLAAFAEGHLGAIRLWDIGTNREVAVFTCPFPVLVRFSKRGQALLALGGGVVRIWNLAAAAREKLVVRAHVGGTPGVTFSPDGKLLVSAGKDRAVRIWDPRSGERIHELGGFRAEVESVTFNPDGSILATGDFAGDIRFWQVPTWQELLPALNHGMGPPINACAFSADGRFFGACGQGGLIVWKVSPRLSGERGIPKPWLHQLVRFSDRPISSLSFSADGGLLAWTPAFGNFRIHLWDVRNSRPYPFPPVLPKVPLRNMALYGNRKQLVLIGGSGGPEVWDVITRERVFPSGADDFRGAGAKQLYGYFALSADNAWLATSGARGAISVWGLQLRKLLLALPEEGGLVWNLAWSPDREFLAVSFFDGSIVVWNIPVIRAQLAEIGLDWEDSPLPVTRANSTKTLTADKQISAARLFALDVAGTAQASASAEGDVCRVDVTASDSTIWHVTLARLFDDAQEGSIYRLNFRAKASAPRRIRLAAEIDQPDWHTIGLLEDVPVTEQWQTYQYEFQAKNIAVGNTILFKVGDRTGTVWIADFSLTKVEK